MAAIAARGVDRQEGPLDMEQQDMHARQRRIVEQRGTVATGVTADEDTIAERAVTERELATQVRTDDLDATARVLAKRGVPHAWLDDDVLVGADQGAGAAIRFLG